MSLVAASGALARGAQRERRKRDVPSSASFRLSSVSAATRSASHAPTKGMPGRLRRGELDPGKHKRMPKVQLDNREEWRVQPHDMPQVPIRVVLDLRGPWSEHGKQLIRQSRAVGAFDRDLYSRTEKKMEEMQLTSDLTWIEVQFLKKAVDTVTECRMTLKWTYAMAYYLARDNMTELFEDNQRDLERAVEDLSSSSRSPSSARRFQSSDRR
ncbi:hypothetical protein L7F22_064651 [Adiantum nelumboides]|nr:hypothetical protein [Adiantum nelumboides]